MTTFTMRLRGLAATIALLAFVAGTPLALVAINAVPDLSAFSWSRLTAPDDGSLALEVIAIVAWVAWAVFTFTVVTSIASRARGVRPPWILGLAMPQLAADRLVAAAALLFVAIPTASVTLPQARAVAAVSVTPLPAPAAAPEQPVGIDPAPKSGVSPESAEPRTETYTVKRGDSLWRIAEDRLGDGTRYVELVDLNRTVLGGRPDFLLPGTVLRVPAPEPGVDDSYVVKPGDTLSEIAEDQLGDASAYTSVFNASRDTMQADGAHLTDPDLIRPGWKLTVPGLHSAEAPTEPHHAQTHEGVPDRTPPTVTPTPEPTPDAAAEPPGDVDEQDAFAPSWLLTGLAGSGAVLGAALWLTTRARRRTQLRYRHPGTIIAPPPPEVLPADKTARASASAIGPRIEALDAALRSLAPLPRLVTATLSDTQILLTMAEPATPAPPWAGSDTTWQLALTDVPERPEDSFPPYPLLVSVGQASDKSFVFLNLEELRNVTVTGDPERRTSFARHLAAELAVNPWSGVTRVDVLGLGPELAAFNLGRVHAHPAGDTNFLTHLARELEAVTSQVEPDDFHAALIATASRPEGDVSRLASAIDAIPGRSSAALVDLCGEPGPSGTQLDIGADGRLRAERLDLDVLAAGLTAGEARACALLLDLTLDDDVVRVPQPPHEADVSDLAGALVGRLLEGRPDGSAGAGSLLPLDARVYADAAATTPEDIAAVAPVATRGARAEVQAADPDLDEDLARWESPVPIAPKLTLLGPVGARALGDVKATASRRPYFVELLAYLTLHPRGTTADDLAAALDIRSKKARGDLSSLRLWLGTDRDGMPFLPPAQQTHEPGTPATYRLHGVLSDLDLFRRLRARGQSRGEDGIEDLVTALRLVTGEPFTNLRPNGWNWLLEGDRLDHIMTSAIVDVGHVVTSHALAAEDFDLAKFASSTALTAAPYDEIAQLDMVAVERATGDIPGSDARLRDNVSNRRDDDLPPIDLPSRSARIAESKAWFPPRQGPRRTG